MTAGLWPRVRDAGMATVAVMGMAKNTGKTVALNHLLAGAARDRLAVGLSSIGRDGEELDAVFSFPKPPVVVWPGMVVATARDTLQRARVRTRALAGTGITSPLGEIVLVQVLERGEMEVAGASRSADQRHTTELLRRCGAELVFLDGALGRSQHASPAVADGVLLATGAAVGGGLADVLRKTRDRLVLLGLPAIDGAARERCKPLYEGGSGAGGVGLWARDGKPLWCAEIPSLNAAETLLDHAAGHEIGTVAVTGAVGRRLWQAFDTLAERHTGLQVVVADGTRLFVDAAEFAALARHGAHVAAWRAIRVAGVTTNPFSPMGGHLDATALRDAARAAFPEHAVHDVMLEPTISQDHRHGPIAA